MRFTSVDASVRVSSSLVVLYPSTSSFVHIRASVRTIIDPVNMFRLLSTKRTIQKEEKKKKRTHMHNEQDRERERKKRGGLLERERELVRSVFMIVRSFFFFIALAPILFSLSLGLLFCSFSFFWLRHETHNTTTTTSPQNPMIGGEIF